MKQLPTISIITCTFNTNLVTFRRCLEAIRMQKYPKKNIEHLVIDAGSTNGTIELAREYGCTVIVRKDLKQREQVRQSIGFKTAKGDILLILESDNIFVGQNWLFQMVRPFKDNKDIFCTYSAYNGFEKDDTLLTRYTALFGSPHPILYYLGKSDKIPITQKKYNKGEIVSETDGYTTVRFTLQNLVTCGDNGHMILRSVMNKVNRDPETYTHLDAVYSMVELGFDTFGVVKNSIIHEGKNNLLVDVRRKIELKSEFYDKRRGKRTYMVFDWQSSEDRIKLYKYIFFSVTLIEPLYESIRGFIRIRDSAWFIHPIFCLLMLGGHVWSEARWYIKKHIFTQ